MPTASPADDVANDAAATAAAVAAAAASVADSVAAAVNSTSAFAAAPAAPAGSSGEGSGAAAAAAAGSSEQAADQQAGSQQAAGPVVEADEVLPPGGWGLVDRASKGGEGHALLLLPFVPCCPSPQPPSLLRWRMRRVGCAPQAHTNKTEENTSMLALFSLLSLPLNCRGRHFFPGQHGPLAAGGQRRRREPPRRRVGGASPVKVLQGQDLRQPDQDD